MKIITCIRRKARRDRARAVAERRFLARRRSKKVGSILKTFPDIGKESEHFVEEWSVGADAWRHTGVLTFDGNKPIGQKVTYHRIKEHLESVYRRKFAYGTGPTVWLVITEGAPQSDTRVSLELQLEGLGRDFNSNTIRTHIGVQHCIKDLTSFSTRTGPTF